MKDLSTKLAAMGIILMAVVIAFSGVWNTQAKTLQATSVPPTATVQTTTKKAAQKTKKKGQTTTTKAQTTTKKKQPTTTKPQTTTAAPAYTDWELEMMSIVIYREAGGNECSNKTRIMVGNVVMNRVRSKSFPNTIYGVLTQRGQYAGMSNGVTWPRRASNRWEQDAVKRARKCAKKVLEGQSYLPSNVVYQSEYRSLGSGVYCVSDGMYFNYA